MSSTILVIHGPNLNLLGKREPEVYGYLTLEDINQQLISQAQNASISLNTFQSNWEGAIVDRIHHQSLIVLLQLLKNSLICFLFLIFFVVLLLH